MRIIAGRFRGVRLQPPKGGGLRPTTDRVREAVFSSLGSAVTDSRVLDLFAGTGAFGIEALSRGASHAMFVEADSRQADRINRFIRTLGLQQSATVMAASASKALQRLASAGSRFDLVFMDPPYLSNLLDGVLADKLLIEILAPQALIVAERYARSPDPMWPAEFTEIMSRRYGQTLIEIRQAS